MSLFLLTKRYLYEKANIVDKGNSEFENKDFSLQIIFPLAIEENFGPSFLKVFEPLEGLIVLLE